MDRHGIIMQESLYCPDPITSGWAGTVWGRSHWFTQKCLPGGGGLSLQFTSSASATGDIPKGSAQHLAQFTQCIFYGWCGLHVILRCLFAVDAEATVQHGFVFADQVIKIFLWSVLYSITEDQPGCFCQKVRTAPSLVTEENWTWAI